MEIGQFVLIIIYHLFNIVQSDDWNLYGIPGDGYYISVHIGTPPKKFNLVIDTGSSNLAVAGSADKFLNSFYHPKNSTTFTNHSKPVEVSYTQGWFKGYIGEDLISIPSLNLGSVVTNLSIITQSSKFYVQNAHWQGILGLGYSEISKPKDSSSWLDQVSKQWPKNSRFDIQLCGPKRFPLSGSHQGKFSLGETKLLCERSPYTSPIKRRWYYEVTVTDMKIGASYLPFDCYVFNTPISIVDSGTSNLKLSPKVYNEVILELIIQTNSHLNDSFWRGKEEICLNSTQILKIFPSLTIYLRHNATNHFGVTITPLSYLRPYLLRDDSQCWFLGIEKSDFGTVLGAVILEGMCVTFDRKNDLILFAQSDCGPSVDISPIYTKKDINTCEVPAESAVNGAIVALCVILVLVFIPLCAAFLRWLWLHSRSRRVLAVPLSESDDEY